MILNFCINLKDFFLSSGVLISLLLQMALSALYVVSPIDILPEGTALTHHYLYGISSFYIYLFLLFMFIYLFLIIIIIIITTVENEVLLFLFQSRVVLHHAQV